jgi:DeoR/GlpR family transcriptional regulator of sugar metabolism
MRLLYVGIVGAIHRAERPVSRDAALEFFRHFLNDRLFQGISATRNENRARDQESDREGLQARRILKKVTSDK